MLRALAASAAEAAAALADAAQAAAAAAGGDGVGRASAGMAALDLGSPRQRCGGGAELVLPSNPFGGGSSDPTSPCSACVQGKEAPAHQGESGLLAAARLVAALAAAGTAGECSSSSSSNSAGDGAVLPRCRGAAQRLARVGAAAQGFVALAQSGTVREAQRAQAEALAAEAAEAAAALGGATAH